MRGGSHLDWWEGGWFIFFAIFRLCFTLISSHTHIPLSASWERLLMTLRVTPAHMQNFKTLGQPLPEEKSGEQKEGRVKTNMKVATTFCLQRQGGRKHFDRKMVGQQKLLEIGHLASSFVLHKVNNIEKNTFRYFLQGWKILISFQLILDLKSSINI